MKYYSNDPNLIIKQLICQNRGCNSFATKQELIEAGSKRGLIISDSLSKEQIYDLIITVYTANELEVLFNVGLSSYDVQQKFDVTNYEVKKLAKNGVISVTGNENFSSFGKRHTAPLYSVFDFCRLTSEEVHNWLNNHRRGRKNDDKVL